MKFFPTTILKTIVLLGLLASCNSGKYKLQFQPAHDTDYRLTTSMGGQVGLTLMGKDMNTDMQSTIVSQLHFDTLPNQKTAVGFSYQEYHLGQQAETAQFNTDSVGTHADSITMQIKQMLQKLHFAAIMNAQGKMETKTSTDSLWQVLEAALAPLDQKLRTQVAASLKPLINDDMMVGMVEQCFHILPKTSVDVGDKWRNQLKMTSMFSMIINNEFELLSVKNGVAEIAVHATITNSDKQGALPGLAMASSPMLGQPESKKGFDLMGVKFEATFSGTQEGVLVVDMGTGVMQSAKIHQLLDGKFKINSMEFPMKLNMKNEYECERL
ncbi:MAG TPA: DUF6263 family protein [Phnomibacter sp.]|nr:DUF6263 family protein [Phnomibacter sp.]